MTQKSHSDLTEESVERALDYLRDCAEEAAQATANRIYVEEYSKVVKAQLMQENNLLPLGAQEREAYAHPRYIAHLEALKCAVEKDMKHRFLRRAAEARIEAWQTMSANHRSMKI